MFPCTGDWLPLIIGSWLRNDPYIINTNRQIHGKFACGRWCPKCTISNILCIGSCLKGCLKWLCLCTMQQYMSGTMYHYCDVIMGAMASKISSLTSVYTTVYSGANQRKPQSSASLAFMRGIHRWPVNSPPKGPVTRIFFFHLMTSSCSVRAEFWCSLVLVSFAHVFQGYFTGTRKIPTLPCFHFRTPLWINRIHWFINWFDVLFAGNILP